MDSAQSRSDVLALALAATVLLQGLVWKSIQPRPVISVRASSRPLIFFFSIDWHIMSSVYLTSFLEDYLGVERTRKYFCHIRTFEGPDLWVL
jgi:hypothetical protein